MIETSALTHLIQLTGNVADAFTTALYTVVPGERKLVMREHLTLSSALDPKKVIPFGDGPIGKTAERLTPRLDEYFDGKAPNLKMYRRKEEIKCILTIPVIYEHLEGVLVVDTKESYSISPKLQKIIISFADQIAWHLHWDREEQAAGAGGDPFLRKVNNYIRFLSEAPSRGALSDRLGHLPGSILFCDALAVTWFNENTGGTVHTHTGFSQELEKLHVIPGKGLVGSCAKNRAPLLLANSEGRKTVLFAEKEKPESFNSVMVVPIILQQRVHGVLLCASREAGSFSSSDLDRLSLIASSAAAALFCLETKNQWDQDKNLDQITGLPNHRFLIEHQRSLAEEVFESGAQVYFLTARLTNLPAIYETFGLEAGDQLLRLVSSTLTRVVPSPKYLFKYSDTSFLVVLLNNTESEAYALRKKLRQVFDHNPIFVDGKSVDVRTEWGLAAYPADGKNFLKLVSTSWSRTSQELNAVQ